MSRNGSGVYSNVAGVPFVTGTTISSTVMNNQMADYATALTNSIAVDGQSVISANIPMNSKKLTGLAAATTAGDALAYGQSAMGPIAASTGVFSGALSASNVLSGTYTPTVTNIANIQDSTPLVCQYMRVGNVVTVSGGVNINPTATATATEIAISLPIASALASITQLGGTAAQSTNTSSENLVAQIYADVANDRASLAYYTVNNVSANNWYFSFTYLVI